MASSKKSSATNIGVVLLAAGTSSRLGAPKQLLSYGDQTLIQYMVKTAGNSIAKPVIVVLGAHADDIAKKIDSNNAKVVVNKEWQEGMAASIRTGINYLMQEQPTAEGAILMVCDQPDVTSQLLNELMDAHQQTGKPIITCSYANTFGPPTFFHKSIFPDLLQLKGDVGARSILQQHVKEVESIEFPRGNRDIDTKADYEELFKDTRAT